MGVMPLSPADLDLILHPPDLRSELRWLVARIPPGRVVSFGDLAEALGDVKAARWVATELQELDPAEFPIHRVIRRTGTITGSAPLDFEERIARLRREGIVVIDNKVDLAEHGWQIGSAPQTLASLQLLQDRIAEAVKFAPLGVWPDRVGGVDVSYASNGKAVAAYAVVDSATGKLLHQEIICDDVMFPYIPGYLAFREIPLYARLLDQVRRAGRLEPIVLVDGNGILHPRRAGIATMLGLAAGVRTVGVSKHLLCGKVVENGVSPAPILAGDDTVLGFRLKRESKRSTLYVSPGAGIDSAGSLRLVESQLRGRRLAEPIFHADRLSREAARQF